MPKATATTRSTRSAGKKASEEAKPYTKANSTKPKTKSSASTTSSSATKTSSTTTAPQKSPTSRTGKDSHLYTDDNPTTTLHGTGFKDAETARGTLELVSKRSLLYQLQTINTLYHRANNHPHSASSPAMQEAMQIFRTWLDEAYPAARAAQREFNPLLRRDVVEKYLPRVKERMQRGVWNGEEGERMVKWAEMYVALPKGKRLANVLMDEREPGEADMAKVRQDVLEGIVEGRGREIPRKDDGDVWDGEGDRVSDLHLRMIAYGWSPVRPEVLLKKIE